LVFIVNNKLKNKAKNENIFMYYGSDIMILISTKKEGCHHNNNKTK